MAFANAAARLTYSIKPFEASAQIPFLQEDTGVLYRAIRTGAGAENWEQMGEVNGTVAADATPVLGGDLDVADSAIISTTDRDIVITPDGDGTTVITDVVLASDMDVNAFAITTTEADGDIAITPDGTGRAVVTNLSLTGNADVGTAAITTSTVNGGITLTPDGTGAVVLKGHPIVGRAAVALTDAATIATDCALGNLFTVTLGGNRTLGNPTNGVPGARYTWVLTQDGTGSRTITLGNQFRVAGGNCALTATAAAVDVLDVVCVTTSLFYVVGKELAVAADS